MMRRSYDRLGMMRRSCRSGETIVWECHERVEALTLECDGVTKEMEQPFANCLIMSAMRPHQREKAFVASSNEVEPSAGSSLASFALLLYNPSCSNASSTTFGALTIDANGSQPPPPPSSSSNGFEPRRLPCPSVGAKPGTMPAETFVRLASTCLTPGTSVVVIRTGRQMLKRSVIGRNRCIGPGRPRAGVSTRAPTPQLF